MRQCTLEEFEDTKGEMRVLKSKKVRQNNVLEKKDKRTNNDLQNIHKAKDRVTRTTPKPGCSGRVGSSCSTSSTRRVYLVTKPVISHEWEKDREVTTTSGTYRDHNICH
jgi:hypothetical protein